MSTTYDERLEFSQGIRKQIIEKLIAGGIPTDPETLKLILTTLKDSDGTELAKRKNGIDDKQATTGAAIAAGIAEFVKAQKNTNPFARNPDGSAISTPDAKSAVIPTVDPVKLGEHDLVEGEGEIGNIQEDSESFFKRMGVSTKPKE